MNKRVVVRVAARGYVDGRYIGEEKEVIESVMGGRGKRSRKGKAAKDGNAAGPNARGKRGRKGPKGVDNDSRGNRALQAPNAKPKGRGKRNSGGAGVEGGDAQPPRGRRGRGRPAGGAARPFVPSGSAGPGNTTASWGAGTPNAVPDNIGNAVGPLGEFQAGAAAGPRGARRNRSGRKTPFRTQSASRPAEAAVPRGRGMRGGKMGPQSGRPQLISEVAEARRWADESKSGQFAEALAAEARIKRERLHKVLAQSGHGSRRDMEILISSGRVMVNGIVATTGTSVSANDQVMIDHRPVKLKFSEELPRVLLYHKPEGEIVTTNDPGNRITVFDNLPRVENGKWISVGRLDINTSGLLIFTTSGELANRLMHPRYEVEREYAVRLLGELTEEQTATLMAGVSISNERDTDDDDDNEPIVDERPARFDVIEKRGGEGVNQWYHVVIREGRNREVRRMFEAVGLTVSRLMRVRFGKIGLPPRLSRGRMMELDPAQVRSVLRWVGMEAEGPTAPLPGFAAPSGPRPVGSAVDTASTGSSEATRVPSTDGSMRPKRHRARRSRGRPDEAGELGQMHSGLDAQNGEAPALGAHGGGVPGDASVPRIDGQPDPRARKNRRGTRGRQRRRGPPDAVGGGGANVANAVPSVNVGPASTPSGAREQPTDDNVGNRVDGNSPTFASPFQEKRAGRDQRDRRGFRGRRRNRRSDEGAPSGNVDAPSGGTDRFDSGNEPDGNR